MRAGLVDRAEAYRWSSAAAHLAGRDDLLVKAAPLLEIVGDRRTFLSEPIAEGAGQKLQRHERTGRPLGDESFLAKLAKLEGLLNRVLKPRKAGRKPKRRAKLV